MESECKSSSEFLTTSRHMTFFQKAVTRGTFSTRINVWVHSIISSSFYSCSPVDDRLLLVKVMETPSAYTSLLFPSTNLHLVELFNIMLFCLFYSKKENGLKMCHSVRVKWWIKSCPRVTQFFHHPVCLCVCLSCIDSWDTSRYICFRLPIQSSDFLCSSFILAAGFRRSIRFIR